MAEARPIMPRATAVWLVDNSTLTFEQIADFVGLHVLEINSIADGEVAVGIRGMDPVAAGQLTREELERCQNDPEARLELAPEAVATVEKANSKRGRFIPVAIRQNRPAAIAWLIRYHPELSNNQIIKLVGTTKSTIESVRDRTHWNIRQLRPADPVSLGLCTQIELDEAVRLAAGRKARKGTQQALSNEERRNLLSSDESLAPMKEPGRPMKTFDGLENFSLTQQAKEGQTESTPDIPADPNEFFNLPSGTDG